MLKEFFQKISWYIWSPMGILSMLCIIFYSAMHYYSVSALEDAPQVNIALVNELVNIRMFSSACFCVLLGYLGVKLSGHVWPAMLVHTLAVTVLLIIDLSLQEILKEWQITLLILASVASLTGLTSAFTLFIFWMKIRLPHRKKS